MTTPNHSSPPTVPVEPTETTVSQEPVTTDPAAPINDDTHPGPGRALMDKAVFAPYSESEQKNAFKGEVIFFPGDTFKENEKFYEENASRKRKRIVTANDIEFADAMAFGQQAGHDDEYDIAMMRPNGDWRSFLETENGKFRASRPKLQDTEGRILSGDPAVQRIRMIAGLGSALTVPLWHTGIWVTMTAPSKDALINMYHQMQMDKIRLGRKTMGLVFSNETIYRTSNTLKLAIDCIEETTLAPGIDIRDVLSHHDIPLLVWAMACLCYPRGFEYARPVRAADESKRRVVKGVVDISKMCIVDNSYLSEWQKKHMSRRMGAVTGKLELDRYRDEFGDRKRRFELIPGRLWMTLKTPTAIESINAGQRWVDSIETLVKSTLQQEATDAQRNRLIATHATSTTMRQFTQWVATIEEEDRVIEERETVEKILDELSELPEIRDRYVAAVNQFINDGTVSIIACPVVDMEEANFVQAQYPKYPFQIPIDPSVVFFQLLAQRIEILEVITLVSEQVNS